MYPLLRRGKRALSFLSRKPSPCNSSAVGHPTNQFATAFTHTLLHRNIVTMASDDHKGKGGRSEEEVRSIFESWMVKHNKTYNSLEEKEKRFKIFKDMLRYIDKENAMPNRTYRVGLNHFSDLTHKEFKKSYLMGLSFKEDSDLEA